MTRILQFVQLSAGSIILNKLITKDYTALWETMDFFELSHCGCKARDRATDDTLAALLTRVNACSMTKKLNLRCCKSI